MRRIIHYIFLLLLLQSCSKQNSQENIITVTIEPYRFVTEAVAGDKWVVRTLFPKGSNPETTDPSPQQMVALADSRLYMLVGGFGFEQVWQDKIASLYPSLIITDTSLGIERDGGDPHLWTSPANMAVIAENICAALCRVDSVGREGYIARLNAFKERLCNVDTLLSERLAACSGKSFVIFHPSLTYFSNRYALQQIAIEHEGKEPSVSHIRSVIDLAKEKQVKMVFVQQEFDKRGAQAIANEIGARVETIDPLSYDWEQQMLHIANSLSDCFLQ